ncbi:MAG TPA: 7-carboxy-7-deazaguanine synthase QueE [Bacteroidia bacterium]|nr:7-carboxy-7-deazaguanine synthase QueE [Bacteroidia bacterium]
MEHYYTIQGEGYNTGTPAYFIRLGGCDVGCVWCDVKDSWDAMKYPLTSIDEMIELVKKANASTVVITGGEPLMNDLTVLTKYFHENNIRLWLETSGTYPLSGEWNWICVSPKKFKAPLKTVLEKADELKVVIFNRPDFDWAEQHAAMITDECKLFLQPEFSRQHQMLPEIIEYIKQNPRWRISLQTHKYMNVP